MPYKYRGAIIPAVIVCALACAALLALFRVIPPPADVLASLARALGSATPQFIAACSFVENLVAINAYFPGAFVILFAMAACHGDPSRASVIFATIAGASIVAQHLNYLAGRLLRRRVGAHAGSVGFIRGLMNYWHPQLGAVYSFRAGLAPTGYHQFARAMCAWAVWTMFWGVLMYELGAVPLAGNSFLAIFVTYLIGWFVIEVMKARRSRNGG